MPFFDARKTMTLENANNSLRFALNELKALDAGEQAHTDRKTCAFRLRALADHLENNGTPPDACAIIHEAFNLPIQH